MNNAVKQQYGNYLRVRVCGVCIENDHILMVGHTGVREGVVFWCPPGGGVNYGENSRQALVREFKEETGLDIEVGQLLFVHEHLHEPLHAIELFFEVKILGGKMTLGYDPEMTDDQQIIHDLQWLDWHEIEKKIPKEVHQAFGFCENLSQLRALNGYLAD
jgi:8-oxo-dGTP diphosphatase